MYKIFVFLVLVILCQNLSSYGRTLENSNRFEDDDDDDTERVNNSDPGFRQLTDQNSNMRSMNNRKMEDPNEDLAAYLQSSALKQNKIETESPSGTKKNKLNQMSQNSMSKSVDNQPSQSSSSNTNRNNLQQTNLLSEKNVRGEPQDTEPIEQEEILVSQNDLSKPKKYSSYRINQGPPDLPFRQNNQQSWNAQRKAMNSEFLKDRREQSSFLPNFGMHLDRDYDEDRSERNRFIPFKPMGRILIPKSQPTQQLLRTNPYFGGYKRN